MAAMNQIPQHILDRTLAAHITTLENEAGLYALLGKVDAKHVDSAREQLKRFIEANYEVRKDAG